MPALNLHGVYARDPNENPMMLPFGGAVLGEDGNPETDAPDLNPESFNNEEGWDPPSGNGLLPNQFVSSQTTPLPTNKVKPVYTSKLDHLLDLEEQIRDLLIERRELLLDLKREKDEIEKRLTTAEKVSDVLDNMFPPVQEPDTDMEFKPEEEEEL